MEINQVAAILAVQQYVEQLGTLIKERLKKSFGNHQEAEAKDLDLMLSSPKSPFDHFVTSHQLGNEEILLLLIALAPHLYPDFYDRIVQENIPEAGDFPIIGGVRGRQFRGFLPTGQTASYVIAGENEEAKIRLQHLFSEEHFFAKNRVLWLEETPSGEPALSGKLVISPEYLDLFIYGKVSRPRFSMTFPAKLIETKLEWKDLVLNKETLLQIKELQTWITFNEILRDQYGMGKKVKPGYRALFHGPPGTGKTLTASLLGKYTQKDVYRVDLSMIVSKYIGETEKNLHNLFTKAESKDWILFFDEADALFGKRTNVKDAHDKYANQEVSYLLQRIEDYNGLTILASNFKSNIDDAFMRRFQAIIHFPKPKASERYRLWKNAFPVDLGLARNVDLNGISRKYELTGSNIINIAQYCCLQALSGKRTEISQQLIEIGIKKEFLKEGKIVN